MMCEPHCYAHHILCKPHAMETTCYAIHMLCIKGLIYAHQKFPERDNGIN
jgi:hypothetical protein